MLKTKSIQAVRGMHDILPNEVSYWQHVERLLRKLVSCYDYHEIRFPLVEQTQLFKRTIGDVTDIVEKEMYTFEDRNGDSLSLRPEGTAGCVRAGIENGLLYNQIQKLWYLGPMFRYENPQKGRYRQFHQFAIESFGMAGPDIDVEQILMTYRLWQELKLNDQIELQINSLGSPVCRARFREKLVAYYQEHYGELDPDSQKRLQNNPLRILDSKNSVTIEINRNAPKLLDFLGENARNHFNKLCQLLDAAKVPYTINPYIVRGLDYYCYTVYEWVTSELGTQSTVCAGGRYDALVEQLGGKPTPAVGFALGIERVVLLLQAQQELTCLPHVCFILVGDEAVKEGLILAEKLRNDLPSLRVSTNLSGGGFKSQFKRADKSGARYAAIIAEKEVCSNKISLKDLRSEKEQQQFSYTELKDFFENCNLN